MKIAEKILSKLEIKENFGADLEDMEVNVSDKDADKFEKIVMKYLRPILKKDRDLTMEQAANHLDAKDAKALMKELEKLSYKK